MRVNTGRSGDFIHGDGGPVFQSRPTFRSYYKYKFLLVLVVDILFAFEMSLPLGIICTAQEYERSRDDGSISCLTRLETIGILVVVQASLLSLLAIFYVFLLIIRNIKWRIKHMPTARLRVFHQPLDIVIFSLLLSDTLQAIGTVLSLKWIQDGKVEVGTFCNVQGTLKIFGATGVALSTLITAIYTSIGVWRMKGISSMRTTLGAVLFMWLSIAILVLVGHATHTDPSKPFMGPTPYWCFVSAGYLEWRVLGEYLWMWLALFLSCLIYIPLYLWLRGNIISDPSTRWKWRLKRAKDSDPCMQARRSLSLIMLLYPLVYCITIMPLSIVRWISFVDQEKHVDNMPSGATFTAESIFALSGFFNVVLLLTTRPQSGLFGELMFVSPARLPSNSTSPGERSDVEQRGAIVRLPDKYHQMGSVTTLGGQ